MILTQSQRHWRAWVSALQTRDADVRAVALEQLGKFLEYWTRELYHPAPSIRGILNGRDTPQPESWEEVFNVDTDSLITNRSDKRVSQSHLDTNEAWVCSSSPIFYYMCTGFETSRWDLMDWMNILLTLIISTSR